MWGNKWNRWANQIQLFTYAEAQKIVHFFP